MKKMKNIIKITIFVGVVVFLIFLFFGVRYTGMLSIIGNDVEKIEIPYSCSVSDDCIKNMIDDGATTENELKYFQSQYNIVCESNKCFGVLK